jgi:hypothetical protein
MGMHTLDDLMLKWQHEKLTAEQVIGQLLQHMGVLYAQPRLVERRLGSIESQHSEHILPNTTKPIPPQARVTYGDGSCLIPTG